MYKADINASVLKQVRTDAVSLDDAAMPCLAIAYSLRTVAGELASAQKRGATITIAPTGGTGSKLRISIKVYSADSAGTETSATTAINGAATTTLKDLLIALNAIEGVTAWALNAPHDMSLDSDDFIALAETEIRTDGKPLNCLYRDVSEFVEDSDKIAYLRIGNPEARDSGKMALLSIKGTSTGATNGLVILYRDDYDEGRVELSRFTLSTSLTSYVDHDREQASVYRGPLLLAVRSDDLSAVDIRVRTENGEM